MVANPHRGEVEAPLHSGAVTLRPTWEAVAAIESATGLGLYNMAHKLSAKHISLIDLSVIIAAGASAAGTPMTNAQALDAVMETGVMRLYPAVLAFVTNAVTGGTVAKEPKSGEA